MSSGTDNRKLAALVALGAVIWSINLAARQTHLDDDRDAYRQFAQNWCDTGTFGRTLADDTVVPSAYRPPLYPACLATFGRWRQVDRRATAGLHLSLLVILVLLVYRLGRSLSPATGLVAGAFVVFDPLLLHWSAYPMTETVATVLAAAILWYGQSLCGSVPSHDRSAMHRRWPLHALWFGMLCGLAILCRPVFAAWTALLLAALPAIGRTRQSLLAVGIVVGGLAVVVAPWTIRNALVVGRPTPFTTHGGYTLLLGNNSAFYDHLRRHGWRSVWDAESLQRKLRREGIGEPTGGRQEADDDRRCYQLAWEAMRREPQMFVWSSVVRVMRLWNPLPLRTQAEESTARWAARWITGLWYTAIYGLAMVGVLRLGLPAAVRSHRRDAASLGRLLQSPLITVGALGCLGFTMVHAVYWSNMRMRAPLMPWIYLAAAAGLVALQRRAVRSKRRRSKTRTGD